LALPPEQSPASANGPAANSNGSGNGAVLEVRGLSAGYGGRQVIFDVDFNVREREVVTILGHNGAGKTTTLKSVFGLIRPLSGSVVYCGQDIAGRVPAANVREGMSFTPPERFVFPDLSVLNNLRLGGISEPSAERKRERLERVYEMFPVLRERSKQLAGTMSGGEQRMVALGIALMGGPRLMLLDEPSLGLAPSVVDHLMDAVRKLADEQGISVILLEQNVAVALNHADRAYIMRSGRIILEEPAETMRARGHWWDLF
jgi:branched-chain amino acid transport system ATP-binding protein